MSEFKVGDILVPRKMEEELDLRKEYGVIRVKVLGVGFGKYTCDGKDYNVDDSRDILIKVIEQDNNAKNKYILRRGIIDLRADYFKLLHHEYGAYLLKNFKCINKGDLDVI